MPLIIEGRGERDKSVPYLERGVVGPSACPCPAHLCCNTPASPLPWLAFAEPVQRQVQTLEGKDTLVSLLTAWEQAHSLQATSLHREEESNHATMNCQKE